jgi:hypothetical protein
LKVVVASPRKRREIARSMIDIRPARQRYICIARQKSTSAPHRRIARTERDIQRQRGARRTDLPASNARNRATAAVGTTLAKAASASVSANQKN